MSQNSTQHYSMYPDRHSLESIGYPQVTEAFFAHHWICSSCGMAHQRKLPEECESCGATALEFEYSAPTEAQAPLM